MASLASLVADTPRELIDKVSQFLGPQDLVNLHLATHKHPLSNAFELGPLHLLKRLRNDVSLRTKILDNSALCGEIDIESRGRISMFPAKLIPSAESGLDTSKSYSQHYDDCWRKIPGHYSRYKIQKAKKKDVAPHRYRLIFMSLMRREDRDKPRLPEDITKYGNASTWLQLIQNPPRTYSFDNEHDRNVHLKNQRNAIKVRRNDDEDLRFQAAALYRVLFRLARDPIFLPSTCRTCLGHFPWRKILHNNEDFPFCFDHFDQYARLQIKISALFSMLMIKTDPAVFGKLGEHIHSWPWIKPMQTADRIWWVSPRDANYFTQLYAGVDFVELQEQFKAGQWNENKISRAWFKYHICVGASDLFLRLVDRQEPLPDRMQYRWARMRVYHISDDLAKAIQETSPYSRADGHAFRKVYQWLAQRFELDPPRRSPLEPIPQTVDDWIIENVANFFHHVLLVDHQRIALGLVSQNLQIPTDGRLAGASKLDTVSIPLVEVETLCATHHGLSLDENVDALFLSRMSRGP